MSPIRMAIEQLPQPDTIIIAGSGKTLMELGTGRDVGEFWAAKDLFPDAHVMAVNFTAPFIVGPLHHVVSLHAGEVDAFRRPCQCLDWRYGWPTPVTHSNKPGDGVDRVWPEFDNEEGRSGSSALFGVKVALALGFTRVVVAGVPLDNGGRFMEPARMPATAHGKYDLPTFKAAWLRARDSLFAGRVFSMGGWLSEQLGIPTKETRAA